MRVKFANFAVSFIALGCFIGTLAPSAGLAKPAKMVKVAIPFESERAALRGDGAQVQLNDEATLLPAHRVRGLPIIDGRMGEHIQMDGVTIYMPFGRVISATAEFRPDGKAGGKTPRDSSYSLVSKFDAALGPVCATESDGGSPVQMRINRDKAMSLVKFTGGTAQEPAFRVETSLETRYFREPSLASRLATECKSFRAAAAKN